MIEIHTPSAKDITDIQERERAFYWSRCADALFQKHGIMAGIADSLLPLPRGLPIVTRYTSPGWNVAEHPGVFECPLSEDVCKALGLRPENFTCDSGSFITEDGRNLSRLVRSWFKVRHIPKDRTVKAEPFVYVDPDERWNNREIQMQRFEVADGWKPIAFVQPDGEDEKIPIVISNGRQIVLGAPLLDVMSYMHALPALDASFHSNIDGTNLYEIEKWLNEEVKSLAVAAGEELQCMPIWPNEMRSAFTIRHDFDRPVEDVQFDEMLSFYREHGLKATWFLLIEKWPEDHQVRAMLEGGHEIALHSEAPHFDDFRSEVEEFRQRTGFLPPGYSCHGGTGSRGQLALTQYQWSETLGLNYGEMIGRARGLPHPVFRPACGIPETGSLIIQNSHFSFDLSTKPEAHQLESFLRLIPSALESGAHVVVMNHPDIHWPELKTLLGDLKLRESWSCTLEEAALWSRVSKFPLDGRCGERSDSWQAPKPRKLQKRTTPRKARGADADAAFATLSEQIDAWFKKNAAHVPRQSIENTIRLNTTDVPARVQRLLDPILETLGERDQFSILDVGCGYGGIAVFLANRFEQSEVIAIDKSERFFSAGMKCANELGLNNVDFKVEDILNLTSKSAHDLIILSNVINYLTTRAELERGLENVMQALKPGGWVVVHTPHAGSYREPFTKVPMLHTLPRKLRARVSSRLGKRKSFDDVRLPSYFELRRIMSSQGGVIRKCEPSGMSDRLKSTHLTVWVEKPCPDQKVSPGLATKAG